MPGSPPQKHIRGPPNGYSETDADALNDHHAKGIAEGPQRATERSIPVEPSIAASCENNNTNQKSAEIHAELRKDPISSVLLVLFDWDEAGTEANHTDQSADQTNSKIFAFIGLFLTAPVGAAEINVAVVVAGAVLALGPTAHTIVREI